MSQVSEFHKLLELGDVDALRAAWATIAPHLPQPESREAAEVSMHHARTQMASLPLRPRAYSHRWLSERGLPSGLPDEFKPQAERLYPRVVDAVGISVKARSPEYAKAAMIIREAMEDVVENGYADGKTDPSYLKPRMAEARKRAIDKLWG